MEYIIIKDNRNDLKQIEQTENEKYLENLENIEVPSIPLEIIEMFKKDYKFMANFIDYKRDATLALLKIYNTLTVYDDNFNLKVEKDIKNWCEFFELIKKYAKIFTREGLNFYTNKEKNEYNNNFPIMDEKFLAPIIEKIFDKIYQGYLRKFPYWNEEQEKQNDYINIELKDKTDINNIRFYWHFQGIIFIQDTKYGKSIDGISFKAEFNGRPKFQIAAFDLIRLKYFKKIENILKQYIDMIDDKIIAQKFKNFDLDLDI